MLMEKLMIITSCGHLQKYLDWKDIIQLKKTCTFLSQTTEYTIHHKLEIIGLAFSRNENIFSYD